jgi:hypothetical protein
MSACVHVHVCVRVRVRVRAYEGHQIVAMLPYTCLEFPPGSRMQYSNLGILFVGRVIEVVSG